MFNKILIANRGEIAVRVNRTAQALGYRTVAVFSDADQEAPHVRAADEAVRLGPAPAGESYLNIEAILEAARLTGAEAVHPGYGFLSENAAFVSACAENGITFIGPPAHAMELMGSKRRSKEAMAEAGVPTVPGFQSAETDPSPWQKAAEEIGYPVMIKASAGGGGRGMRLVHEPSALADELARAQSEAESAFGDGELILEKAIVRPRHIEIQVFADQQGNAIHLGERDCSVQRRHQKVVEEAPSPFVDETMRQAMGEAAVKAAQACGYVGAGTVEFIVDESRNFYFLEMNTRLQVEHPVTEEVTGLDLVELQLRIAQGEPLPLVQEEVRIRGHAIEVRLYAEDPAQGYMPQTGPLYRWRPALGDGIRVDDGILEGNAVTPHYDPMIAKVVARGPDRDSARRRLIRSLEDTVLLGVTHNAWFLSRILGHETFAAGDATTAFLDTEFQGDPSLSPLEPTTAEQALAALILYRTGTGGTHGDRAGWSNSLPSACPILLAGSGHQQWVRLIDQRAHIEAWVGETRHELRVAHLDANELVVTLDGVRQKSQYQIVGSTLYCHAKGRALQFEDATHAPARRADEQGSGEVRATMDGAVVEVSVTEGDRVQAGQTLAVLEAMKMEHPLRADRDGEITGVRVSTGDQVRTRQILMTVTADASREAESNNDE
ncbi:acetyl/propionyl/methylcrotonyl-CoA carboxylase subunit alpha [Vreelandella utahensis]|uniref:acetyl/propionyl/methylcrotonyl-CoA carboxylase subunit alpha n=1 Tax=Vreelandella halophila TaxID=86177 RepID=UPI000987B2CB|nr:acetyl/propionyl/methylcrotonyl-CoA carboxylase subunit alpha [Halomonas utahensis]